MAIISFDPDGVTDYVPAYGGNRDSESPCVVGLRFVPYSRIQHYSRIISAKTKGNTDPSKVTEITQGIQRRQFVENIEDVSGYFVGSKEVKEAGEFYDTADTDLILEVIQAMESSQKLTEGQRKN
ncbi:MAG: hypothetical protein KAT46_03065 [Deltaproteobacteria bacterium]|nr:hypothetical protein [Deltaproteobacteria bacterium]